MRKIEVCRIGPGFTRGNGPDVELIEKYLRAANIDAEAEYDGCRYCNRCADGRMKRVNPKTLQDGANMLQDVQETFYISNPVFGSFGL